MNRIAITLGSALAVLSHVGVAELESLDPTVVTAETVLGDGEIGVHELELFGADTVADLTGLVPGLHVVDNDSRGFGDVLSMRGAANTLFFGPASVAMVVDDVPMGDVFSYPADLFDPAGLRVLRGPQGAGIGRNAPGGLIEVWSKRPGETNEFSLETEYGSYDWWGGNFRSSGPLGPKLSHTLQIYHWERDGFLHNSNLGIRPDKRDVTGGVANLYWTPEPGTEWRLRVLAERADDGGQRITSLFGPDPFSVASDFAGATDVERQQVSIHGTFDRDFGRFKTITAYQNWTLDPSLVDLDFNPGIGFTSNITQEQEMWTQELRWESPEDSGPWSWRTGLFFMDKSTDGDASRGLGQVQVAPMFFVPYSERTVYAIDEWSVAAYGRAAYQATDRLEFTGGVRLEYVDIEIDRTRTDTFFNTSVVRGDVADWYFSPELGASYQLCDSSVLFARTAVGRKPAGYTAFASTPMLARYEDETNWSNEIGISVSYPEHGLDFSVTGFWNRISDYQLNRPDFKGPGDPTNTSDYFIVNADQVTAIGAEAELLWRPTDRFTLRGSFGYTDAEFDSYADPVNAGVFHDGRQVPYIPEFTGSLGARYEFGNGFYAQSSVRVIGETFFDEGNTSMFRQGSYWTWDAEAGYANEDFSVAVYGRNLLDEEYYTFINPQIAGGTPGDPQRFGVRVRLSF